MVRSRSSCDSLDRRVISDFYHAECHPPAAGDPQASAHKVGIESAPLLICSKRKISHITSANYCAVKKVSKTLPFSPIRQTKR